MKDYFCCPAVPKTKFTIWNSTTNASKQTGGMQGKRQMLPIMLTPTGLRVYLLQAHYNWLLCGD